MKKILLFLIFLVPFLTVGSSVSAYWTGASSASKTGEKIEMRHRNIDGKEVSSSDPYYLLYSIFNISLNFTATAERPTFGSGTVKLSNADKVAPGTQISFPLDKTGTLFQTGGFEDTPIVSFTDKPYGWPAGSTVTWDNTKSHYSYSDQAGEVNRALKEWTIVRENIVRVICGDTVERFSQTSAGDLAPQYYLTDICSDDGLQSLGAYMPTSPQITVSSSNSSVINCASGTTCTAQAPGSAQLTVAVPAQTVKIIFSRLCARGQGEDTPAPTFNDCNVFATEKTLTMTDSNTTSPNIDLGKITLNVEEGFGGGFGLQSEDGVSSSNACSDGIDNGPDGFIDGADADCGGSGGPTPSPSLTPSPSPTPTGPTATPTSGAGGGGGSGGGDSGPTATPQPTPIAGSWVSVSDLDLHAGACYFTNVIPNQPRDYDDGDRIARNLIVGSQPGVFTSQNIPNLAGGLSSARGWEETSYTRSVIYKPSTFLDYVKARKQYKNVTALSQIEKNKVNVWTGNLVISTAADVSTLVSSTRAPYVLIVDGDITFGSAVQEFNVDEDRSIAIISTGTMTFNRQTDEARGIFIGSVVKTTDESPKTPSGLKIVGNLVADAALINSRVNTDTQTGDTASLYITAAQKYYIDLMHLLSVSKYEFKQLQ